MRPIATVRCRHPSLGQRPQHLAVIMHDLFRESHLASKCGIVRREAVAPNLPGASVKYRMSPFFTFRRDIASLVRMMPEDEPTVVILNESITALPYITLMI